MRHVNVLYLSRVGDLKTGEETLQCLVGPSFCECHIDHHLLNGLPGSGCGKALCTEQALAKTPRIMQTDDVVGTG